MQASTLTNSSFYYDSFRKIIFLTPQLGFENIIILNLENLTNPIKIFDQKFTIYTIPAIAIHPRNPSILFIIAEIENIYVINIEHIPDINLKETL